MRIQEMHFNSDCNFSYSKPSLFFPPLPLPLFNNYNLYYPQTPLTSNSSPSLSSCSSIFHVCSLINITNISSKLSNDCLKKICKDFLPRYFESMIRNLIPKKAVKKFKDKLNTY